MQNTYYDYTPADTVVQYITSDQPKLVHMYNRDGVYKGTISDPLIVSRATMFWKKETVLAAKLFLIMTAECFPEKLIKMDVPDMPEWHPLLPVKPGPSKKRVVKFLTGPLEGSTWTSTEMTQYLMINRQQNLQAEGFHLYRLELDPTLNCGYYHMRSGSEQELQRWCSENNILCFRGD